MKKNKMMRLASALLVAVMLTTCTISGTYAKYVTSDTATETARVAKWGVTIITEGEETFKDAYDTTVKSSVTNDDVVAPGTDNTAGVTFTLTGTPEVTTKIVVDIKGVDSADKATDVFLKTGTYANTTTGDDKDHFEVTTNDYHPLVFTLRNGANEIITQGTLSHIEEYLENMSDTYAPNTNLGTQVKQLGGATGTGKPDGTYKLTWVWAFGDTEGVTQYDKEDTLLGNLAVYPTKDYGVNTTSPLTFKPLVEGTDYSTRVAFTITITATQVD